MTATIHECAFIGHPCENFGCRNAMGYRKYYIGRSDVSMPKPLFCEACMKHLIKNVPLELVEGGLDLEQRIREELEAEYQVKLMAAVQGYNALQFRSDIVPVVIKEEAKDENQLEIVIEPEKPDVIYRCLDCNEEFASQNALNGHKKKHN